MRVMACERLLGLASVTRRPLLSHAAISNHRLGRQRSAAAQNRDMVHRSLT